jgi:hypothetical protein
MASESSDDDGRSFGSEPDFAAMADLRLETLIDDDPGPSGAHVFDEINDDSPRDFGHDLEITDGARLRLALETFEDAVYGDGDGHGSGGEPDGMSKREVARNKNQSNPKRVHADRQTTRPVSVQAREWRRVQPHLRARGKQCAFPSGSRNQDKGDPSTLEGVQILPAPKHAEPREASDAFGSAPTPSDDAAPWRLAELQPNSKSFSWWGQTEVLTVFGERASMCSDTHLEEEPVSETFAADGEIVETFCNDSRIPRFSDAATNANLSGESLGEESARLESLDLQSVEYTRARDARRRIVGLPSIDPRVVMALDRAFLLGDVDTLGELHHAPSARRVDGGGSRRFTIADDDPESESDSEWSAADSEELRRWEV